MSRIFQSFGMLYQVPLSFDPVGDHSHFPWIRPSSLLRTMCSTGDLRLLLGGIPTMSEAKGALESFWSIFQSVCPEHGVFRKLRESKGRLSTSQLIPILVHGDEGTTYKRGGMLVLQFTGVIGQGSKKSETPEEWHKHMASCGIPLNLIQNAMTTRFLTFLCPKDNVGKVACFWGPAAYIVYVDVLYNLCCKKHLFSM